MAEKLPDQVFDRPPLQEAAEIIPQPSRGTVIKTYNNVFKRLMERREVLEQRLSNGEFNALGDIAQRQSRGETITPDDQRLIRDFRTLLDARATHEGRRLLNLAGYLVTLRQKEDKTGTLLPHEIEIRENFRTGRFDLIPGGNYPLGNIKTDRYTIAIRDGENTVDVPDGATVEGMLRFIDWEIEEMNQTNLPVNTKSNNLNRLRNERDILYTQSTLIYANGEETAHARTQLESYLIYKNPLLSQWDLPDWLNGQNLVAETRVLNIPEPTRSRWGCLPLLPFIIAVPLFSLCGQPEPAPVPPVTVPPVQEEDCSNGTTPQKFDLIKNPNPYANGHYQRELEAAMHGKNQREFISNDNEGLINGVLEVNENYPGLMETYIKMRTEDAYKAALKVPGQKNPIDPENPFVIATDFPIESADLYQCSSIEEVLQEALKETMVARGLTE